MNTQEVQDKVNPILDALIPDTFTPEYIASASREELRVKAMGILVSKWTQWDGFTAMDIAAEALEDANYHPEAAKIREMLKAAGV